MKKWIITLNLLFYITILNQWNFVESHPTSSSRASPSADGNPAQGQTSTHKSSSTTPETDTGTKAKSSSRTASSRSKSVHPPTAIGTPTLPTGRSSTSSRGTQPPKASSTTPAKTQPPNPKLQPKSSSSATPGTKTEAKSDLIKVTVDISKNQTTNQFDYSKDADFRTYTPKPGHLFNKIVKKSLEIWTAKPDDHGLKAVLMGSKKNSKYLAILLQGGTFALLHKCGKNKPWKDITSDRHDIKKLKFLGDNDAELTTSDYKVMLDDLLFTYSFNDGVNCKKIKLGEHDVWTHSDDPKFAEIKSFSLDLPKNQFSVKNSSDDNKELTTKVALDINTTQSTDQFDFTDENGVITYTPKSGHVFNKVFKKRIIRNLFIWKSTDDLYATMVRINSKDASRLDGVCGILAILLTNNMFKLFIHFASNWQDITKDRHDVTKLKFFGDNDVEIKSCDYKVTLVDFSFTYIFNTGINCKKIKLGDDQVWNNTDDPKFADIKSFSLGLASNKFFVKNSSDDSKELGIKHSTTPKSQRQSESTKPVAKPAVTSATKVSLYINSTVSTDEFSYTDKNGVITFTPKSGHVFSKISDGTRVVWESKDNVCGTLVRTKVTKNIKYLVVLLDNNMFKLFKQHNNEWTDITSQRSDITKLKLFGENDVEISKTDYKVTIEFLSYQYTFNDGVKSRKITYNDNPLWKYTDDPKYSEIKSFSLGLASNSFFVKNQSDEVKKIEKEFEHITTPASPSGGTTQPPKASGTSGSGSSTPPSGTTQPPKTSSATSASQPARSGSRAAQQPRSGGTTPGTQPSRTNSTPAKTQTHSHTH